MPQAASPNPHQRTYVSRMNRVVDYIDRHLAEPLDLGTLAEVAHFSPWHFHRVFQGAMGETLADCVRRMRLEAAARRLLSEPPEPALAIAVETGFASAEVFSRGFRAHFGMTPTQWRRGGWRDWFEGNRAQLRKIHQEVHKENQAATLAFLQDRSNWPLGEIASHERLNMQVEFKTLAPTRLAYMRCTGPYGHPAIGQTWYRFGQWFGARFQSRRKMYGIAQDDPEITPPEKCRYDCCVEVDADFKPEGEIGVQDFPGGRYASAVFKGTGSTIHAAWMEMFREWLPGSGWQPASGPCFELYDEEFVMDEKTGEFTCWLCVPVKPL